MDRGIQQISAIPLDTDILYAQKSAMVGLGFLAQDLLGGGTLAFGLACTPTTPASLAVKIAAGRIYSLQNIDGTPYGSIAADTAHQILKQGILYDPVTLACAAPGTAGQSINYLIQATYQDTDATPVVQPYYNVANPSVPFSGPANSGTPQNTQRLSQCIVVAKAGIPATTGSQATPAADAGYVGLYVVTVANGATTITSGNIATISSAPFTSGSYTAALTGCTTAPTGVVKWGIAGIGSVKQVTAILPILTAASNAVTCGLNGLPANLWPATTQFAPLTSITNNGSIVYTGIGVEIDPSSGILSFMVNQNTSGFTNSGSKGLQYVSVITWLIGI